MDNTKKEKRIVEIIGIIFLNVVYCFFAAFCVDKLDVLGAAIAVGIYASTVIIVCTWRILKKLDNIGKG